MVTHRRLLRSAVVIAATLLLVFTWAQTAPPTAEALFNDTDGDGFIDLGEELAGSDPNDPDSTPESNGAQFLSGLPVCSDGIDNDLDGLIDDDDPYCTDSDGDIVSDPAEVLLGSDPNDFASFPEDSRVDAIINFQGLPVFFCSDGVDNDLDGLVDLEDPGCAAIDGDGDGFDDATEKRYGSDPADPASVPEHETPNPGSCSDGIDNDLNGLTDDADPACGTPSNDDRADATAIPALPFTDGPLILKNATREDGEPRSDCSFGGPIGTVWYTFTAAEDARLIADTAGSDFVSVLAVWRDDGARLTEVTCAYGIRFGGEARVVFQAGAGETYLFQIDGFTSNALPSLTFNVEVGVPPANDDFMNATNIEALPFTDSVDVSAANSEPGEPSCFGVAESSVWYTFTPAEDVLVVADTEGSSFSPILAVWTQTIFGLGRVSCSFGADASQDSRVAIDTEAGATYFFQISRYPFFSTPTDFNVIFNLEVGVPPANDDFAAATVISSLPFTGSVDTLTATTEPDEPLDCGFYSKRQTVWYEFTPTADTFVVANTGGGDSSSLMIAVYEGTSLSDLELFACAGPSYPDTRLGVELDGDEAYFFQVGTPFYGPIFFARSAGGELAEDGPATEDGAATAGFPPPPGSGTTTFNLDLLEVPDCPSPRVSVSDPVGDQLPGFGPPPEDAPDIVSVGTSTSGDWSCVTVEFAGPIDPWDARTETSIFASLAFDTDLDIHTGFGSEVGYFCPPFVGLGFEVGIGMYGGAGILIEFYSPFGTPIGIEIPELAPAGASGFGFGRQFAIALFDERSFTLAVPLDALGGDGEYTYAILAGSSSVGASDCAPNVGVIRAPEPAEIGDANCDGERNALDSILMLQLFAGLKLLVPCQSVADVNGSGVIGPIDAMLVLQYDAGLISHLP